MTIVLWVYGPRVHGLPQSTVHLRLTDDGGLRLCLGQPPHTRWKAPGPRLHGNNSNYIYCEHDQATTPRSPVSNGVYKEFHAAQPSQQEVNQRHTSTATGAKLRELVAVEDETLIRTKRELQPQRIVFPSIHEIPTNYYKSIICSAREHCA